jgi:sec-independent protein translocase protein TatA
MFQVGPMEIVVVAIIALIVLGPAKLPDAAKAMGKGMREFKGALNGDNDDHDRDEPKPTVHAAEPPGSTPSSPS